MYLNMQRQYIKARQNVKERLAASCIKKQGTQKTIMCQ